MKRIIKILTNSFCLFMLILFVTINSLSTTFAHSLTPWANYYPYGSAGGDHHFSIMDSYHIDGNTVKFFWANTSTKNLLSANLTNGVAMWDGLINAVETSSSSANLKITYNPNSTYDRNAYTDLIIPSGHYGVYNGDLQIVFTKNGANLSSTMRSRTMCHELGHVWGIDDIYNLNTGWPYSNLESIMNSTEDYSAATRHDKNAMRICLNNLFFDTGNGWKYQKSPGVWAKDEWINKSGKAHYFNSSGIKVHEIQGSMPTSSMNIPNGVYEIQGKTSGKLIHSANASNGAVAHLWSVATNSTTIKNQQFKFERQNDGTYKITVLSSGSALDNNGSSYNNGNQLKFHIWHGGNNQRWYIVNCGNGYVKFINKHSGLAIDIYNNSAANGTSVQQWTDNSSDAQRFKLLPTNLPSKSINLPDGVYEIQGKTSGKLIHSANSSNGAVAHLWNSTTNTATINNQRFNFERQNDGTYKITVLSSGYVLDNNGWSYSNGNQLKFHNWHGGNNQRWYIVDCGNGYIKFINKHSGLAIDISNNGTENCTPIQQWVDSTVGASAQRFKLLPTNLPTSSMNIPNGIYQIQGKTSGKLIHSKNANDGAVAHLWSATTNPDNINNQRYNFQRQSDGTYKIMVLSSNKVLTDPNLSYENGTQLRFYNWSGANNQKWYVVDCGSGYVKFINKHSGLAIDISNNGTENGTAIQQWKDSAVGASAQRFKLLNE